MDLYRDFLEKKSTALSRRGYLLDCSMINPDLPPPVGAVNELACYSALPSSHRYTVARGIQELREAFSDYYQNRLGVSLEPETQVCVTSGTKDALFHFLSAVCIQGDSVGALAPVYPMYRHVVLSLGLNLVEGRELDDLQGTKAVILNSPQNPTGVMCNPGEVQSWANRNGIYVFHDAVYVDMVPGARSFLDYPLIVESFSLSKSFSVPGWRVGCVAGDPGLIERIATRRSRLDYGVFLPIQKAAKHLLTAEARYPREIASRYEHRGKLFTKNSNGLPFVWLRADPGISDYLLEQHSIAVLPGATFSKDFENYIRVALVLSEEKLLRVVSAIEIFKESHEITA